MFDKKSKSLAKKSKIWQKLENLGKKSKILATNFMDKNQIIKIEFSVKIDQK